MCVMDGVRVLSAPEEGRSLSRTESSRSVSSEPSRMEGSEGMMVVVIKKNTIAMYVWPPLRVSRRPFNPITVFFRNLRGIKERMRRKSRLKLRTYSTCMYM